MSVLLATDADFKTYIEGDKPVVVKYFADWCGNCRLFSPKFKRVSNEEEMSNVVFLEVNAEENPEARKAAQVDNLPYLAVFKDGSLVEGSASSKEEYLRTLIEKVQ
jgi:thiol-disulfide isomerase/thioredoxin